MSNYTKEEIAEFKAKDKRISKIAILKSLIEGFGESETLDVQKMCKTADEFVQYIYNGLGSKTVGKVEEPFVDNVETMETVELPTPNAIQSNIINEIMESYKSVGVPADRDLLKAAIIKEFGKYPSNKSSVDKIMQVISVYDILKEN